MEGMAEVAEAVPEASRRSRWRTLVWLAVWSALFVGALVLTPRYVAQIGVVNSNSMFPAFETGDRVIIEKITRRFGPPARGEVVVLRNPDISLADGGAGEPVVGVAADDLLAAPPIDDVLVLKRVLAVGGDTIEVRDHVLRINRQRVDESYLAPDLLTIDFGPVTVPTDHIYVLGDNRNASRDSRHFGPVPEREIEGRVIVRIWPPSRWGRFEW